MDLEDKSRILAVWNNTSGIPVLSRPRGTSVSDSQLKFRLPFNKENRSWLRNERRTKPYWNGELDRWELPKAWLNDLVERTLLKFGKLYIIQPYREHEKCSHSYGHAQGYECQCSCMGVNHGSGTDEGWLDISDAFSVRWGIDHVSCRLLTRK
jgi:hypothetical protein